MTYQPLPPPPSPPAPAKRDGVPLWLFIVVAVLVPLALFDAATGTGMFRALIGHKKKQPEYGFVDYTLNAVFTGRTSQLADIVQGDLVKIYATVGGSLDYGTQIGGSTTAPKFTVDRISRYGSVS